MRRFIAYILASITIFLGVGASLAPVAKSITAGSDFRNGREMSFRLSSSDDKKIPDDASTYYAEVMDSRLKAYGLSDYTITTSGKDTLKLNLALDNDKEYDNLEKLITTNPIIEVCNLGKEAKDKEEKVEEHPVADTKDYSWHENKAYLTYQGSSTILVMPIPSKAKTEVEEMYKAAQKYEGGSKSSTNDDPKPEEKHSIVLWMNRQESLYADKDKNPDVAKKIIYDKLNTTNFYLNNDHNAFKITFTPAGSDITSIRDAYNEARLMMNLLNARVVNYNCIFMSSQIIPAAVENLLLYGSNVEIAMSSTFIALIIAFLVITLILVNFYRLFSIGIVATSTLNTFLTFLMFVIFKAPFNLPALIGLIAVALLSLITPIVHHAYFSDEVYKGRNLKKANFEASKKTTLLTVDISVISILLGVILYFVGGNSVSSMGVVLIIFSVFNVLINTFIHKGLSWLITNNTAFQDKSKYKLLSLKAEHVPDLSKEEKQTYFGPFINKDFTKKKKISAIAVGAITLASIAGLIAFSATGNTYNTSGYYKTSDEVSFAIDKCDNDSRKVSDKEITDYLTRITKDNNKLNFTDINYYAYSYVASKTSSSVDIKYSQNYVIKLQNVDLVNAVYQFDGGAEKKTLNDIFESTMPSILGTSVDNIRLVTNSTYNIQTGIGFIVLAIATSALAISLYLWIRRYRLSRVVGLLMVGLVSSTASLGIISLTRIVATPVASVAGALVLLLSFGIGLIILHKDKLLIKDERLRDVDTRKAVLKKANALALTPVLILSLVCLYLTVNYLAFGSKVFIGSFVASSLALIVSLVMILTLLTPTINYLDSKFSRVKLPKIKRPNKKKKITKSNEPEEAIFIGIND